MADKDHVEKDLNEDPITGEKGCHPVGSGLGAAAGGAAAGAAGGAIGGPIGAAIGAIVGGIAGGLGGKAVAEEIDPTVENEFWSNEVKNRDYYDSDADYQRDYYPAYRYGWEARKQHADRSWNDVETELEREWEANRDNSGFEWDRARHASYDAWHRWTKKTEGCCNSDKEC